MFCVASFMKPATLHYVVTVEDSIMYGRHFYSACMLSDSIFGVVHSFVVGVGATNTLHEAGTRTFLDNGNVPAAFHWVDKVPW